jgi:membrane protease YdiL (CAAX protease family)
MPYLLQETMFGRWAWVFNGLLWAWLVHAVLKWHFIGMIPGMLAAPLIAQFTQSIWAAFIVHAVPNALLWLLLLWRILVKKENIYDRVG